MPFHLCLHGRAALGARVGAILLSLLLPTGLAAQRTADISGRVTARDGTPLVGAVILLDGSARLAAQTDPAGRYHLAAVDAGPHTVEARRFGYTPATITVEVRAGGAAVVDFALEAAVTTLSGMTVIGSRSDLADARERIAQVPGAVAVIDAAEISATRQANLHDVLRLTPGVYVQPRSGAADESQISVRGSGLRNNFHARGINLLVNGMPYRNADGFTDFESLELRTTEAIEVYKGANALRFGGSTLGGAINLSTRTGYSATPVQAYAEGGAFGYLKGQLSSGSVVGPFDYYASYARTAMDGFRDWSAQRRDRVNLHAGYRLSPTTDVRSFYLFAHVREQLPGSLSGAMLGSDPSAADPGNVANRWGRDYDLHHVGLQMRAQLTPTQRLEVSPYMQYRDIDHPIFEVINQQSHDWGAELRYESTAALGGRENRLTVGLQPATETMRNRQFVNSGGSHGALTRDERDLATTVALYAEDALSLTPGLTATLGGRFDRATRKVEDHFLGNGDQSDHRAYRPVTPRLGLMQTLPGGGQLFANASRTVEPPLFLELSSFGNAGGFIDLEAQDAWQYEVGGRGQRMGLGWDVSLYDVELKNEIVNLNVPPFSGAPFTVPTYRNAPRTRHSGAEVGIDYELPTPLLARGPRSDRVTLRGAYTYGRFRYVSDPTFAGNDLPGAPRHYLTAEARYEHPSGLSLSPSLEWVPSGYYVDSANTTRNAAWHALGVRAEWALHRRDAAIFVSAQNLTDERFSRSVQVDNAAGKPYEPGEPRSLYLGVRWGR
jgi:iron complex outermembrane receptor protein